MFSSAKHPVLTGTAILTCAGTLSRLIGFFYRIFLSRTIGAQGLGIYQSIFPEWQRTFCGTFTDRVLFSVHPRTLDQPSYLT